MIQIYTHNVMFNCATPLIYVYCIVSPTEWSLRPQEETGQEHLIIVWTLELDTVAGIRHSQVVAPRLKLLAVRPIIVLFLLSPKARAAENRALKSSNLFFLVSLSLLRQGFGLQDGNQQPYA
jgi:hypothetical protein